MTGELVGFLTDFPSICCLADLKTGWVKK